MSLHTIKEFATICGVNVQYLDVYKKRGKLFIRKDKLIDDQNEFNANFARKRIKKLAEKKPINLPLPIVKNSYANPPESAADTHGYNLEQQKKALDIALITEKIEIERLKKEKLEGSVIPTDLVKGIFSNSFKAVTNRFYQAAESLSEIMITQVGGTRDDKVKFRGKLIDAINIAVKDSQNESRRAIANIVKEYSQKRGVGESKNE